MMKSKNALGLHVFVSCKANKERQKLTCGPDNERKLHRITMRLIYVTV
jgi:hypothetical protein